MAVSSKQGAANAWSANQLASAHQSLPSAEYDALIIGAGIVGLSAALALHQQGYHVAVLEHKPATTLDLNQLDSRIYAITPGNQALLSQLQVWQQMDASRYCTIQRMQIWADPQQAPLQFDAFSAGISAIGYIVESQQLLHALLQQCQQQQVPVLFDSQLQQVLRDPAGALSSIHLITQQQRLSAQLLIGADGANSWLRQQAAMTVKRDDYQHRALVANFSCEFDHANCARQWFIEQDILALLPLPNQQVSMVWSSHQAEQLMQLDAEQLAQAVASASGMALGQLKLLAPAQTFALAKQSVQHSVAANIVLIGDAAHTVHPMAGQGVNLGLRDVAQLASCLQHKPTNIGDYLLLRQYERARKLDVLSMQGFTHGLYVLFQQQQTWLKKMRQWGMQLPNRWAWLKQQLVRQAIR